MTTVINTPGTTQESSGVGLVVGVIVAIVIVALFLMYGLPALRGTANDGGGTNINIPEKVDVNVQGPAPAAQ